MSKVETYLKSLCDNEYDNMVFHHARVEKNHKIRSAVVIEDNVNKYAYRIILNVDGDIVYNASFKNIDYINRILTRFFPE